MAGCAAHFRAVADAALAVDEASFFFAPTSRGENEMRTFGRLRAAVHVLHDEEVEFVEDAIEAALIDPGMARVRGDEPEGFDLPFVRRVDDLIVGEAGTVRNALDGNAGGSGDFVAVRRIAEVVPAEEIRRVREQARTHRVALAGDGVRTGAGSADVSGHQREIDDGLGGASGFVALIHAHGPPEGDGFAFTDGLGEKC